MPAREILLNPAQPRIPEPFKRPRKPPIDPATLPKRRCKNCPKFFPLTKPNRGFCSQQCKSQFHNYGSAYGTLKQTLENLILKRAREQAKAGFESYVKNDLGTDLLRAGFLNRHRIEPKPRPLQAKQLRADINEIRTVIDEMRDAIVDTFERVFQHLETHAQLMGETVDRIADEEAKRIHQQRLEELKATAKAPAASEFPAALKSPPPRPDGSPSSGRPDHAPIEGPTQPPPRSPRARPSQARP
jgi:hypothetical protein